MGALGAVVLGVLLLRSSTPVGDAIFCAIFTPIFGVLMWLVSRKEPTRRRTVLDRLVGAAPLHDFARGLATAVLVVAGLGLLVLLVVWAIGPDQSWGTLPSLMLGTAIWMGLEIRDHRRAESHD